MKLFIRELPNNSATVMTASGQTIWTFSGIGEACQACREWNKLPNTGPVEYFIESADDHHEVSRVA
jgi:hypothetical protein